MVVKAARGEILGRNEISNGADVLADAFCFPVVWRVLSARERCMDFSRKFCNDGWDVGWIMVFIYVLVGYLFIIVTAVIEIKCFKVDI